MTLPFLRGSLSFVLVLVFSSFVYSQSDISGIVYDKRRNPLSEVDVELLDDYYRTINRVRTDGGGRYQFGGLRNGRYTVKVYAFKYDLEDQSQEQEINTQNLRGGEGIGFFILDFNLLPRKGGLSDNEATVFFAQEVPAEAKKLYSRAVTEFSKNKGQDGINSLNESIKIFPQYFDALERIGKELYSKERYEEAAHFLYKAVEVNPKSALSLYYMGLSFHRLGSEYNKAALASLKQAVILAPSSAQVLWSLGKVERALGNYNDAEVHLLKAKKLSPTSVSKIHQELAQLYSDNLGKYSEAADELELYLKSMKMSDEEVNKIRKIIANLRTKSKTQKT
jgi:tetratricopeptide (TPR) repeat protein